MLQIVVTIAAIAIQAELAVRKALTVKFQALRFGAIARFLLTRRLTPK